MDSADTRNGFLFSNENKLAVKTNLNGSRTDEFIVRTFVVNYIQS